MLRHRMWLVLLGYIVVAVALQVALAPGRRVERRCGFVGVLLALLVGIEAGTLRRFTLGRRGWRNVGIVVGDDRETAERRFFDAWVAGETPTPMSPRSCRARPRRRHRRARRAAPDVIGLFPQPGAQR